MLSQVCETHIKQIQTRRKHQRRVIVGFHGDFVSDKRWETQLADWFERLGLVLSSCELEATRNLVCLSLLAHTSAQYVDQISLTCSDRPTVSRSMHSFLANDISRKTGFSQSNSTAKCDARTRKIVAEKQTAILIFSTFFQENKQQKSRKSRNSSLSNSSRRRRRRRTQKV
jgi:hypothetical protein